MINLLFVCHGNICRSPMAEFIFKDIILKANLGNEFNINSAATSTEALGCRVDSRTKKKLLEHGINNFESKRAVQVVMNDYSVYDYIIVMDSFNLQNLKYIIKDDPMNKIYRLLDFTDNPRDIDDPWYTGDFDTTYLEIVEGCIALYKHIMNIVE